MFIATLLRLLLSLDALRIMRLFVIFFRVIRRMASLISGQARLMASNEALTKQAQNAAHAASAALDGQNADEANSQNDLKELRKELEQKEKQLASAIKDK